METCLREENIATRRRAMSDVVQYVNQNGSAETVDSASLIETLAPYAVAVETQIRRRLAELIGEFDNANLDSAGLFDLVTDGLDDPSWTVREKVVSSLGALIESTGNPCLDKISSLVKCSVRDRNQLVRAAAFNVVLKLLVGRGEFDDASKVEIYQSRVSQVIAILQESLVSDRVQIRARACVATGRFVLALLPESINKTVYDSLLKDLVGLIQDSHEKVRKIAVQTVGGLGTRLVSSPCFSSALPLLVQRRYERNPKIAKAASSGLDELKRSCGRELKDWIEVVSRTQEPEETLRQLLAIGPDTNRDWEKVAAQYEATCRRRAIWIAKTKQINGGEFSPDRSEQIWRIARLLEAQITSLGSDV